MIRIATIGTSSITCSLLEAVESTPGVSFVGTLSRDAARAASFTSEHGGTLPFGSLGELAESTEVDAVYIASPNALHHKQALACIAGGKHVLVEKPFCANEREAREVLEAAQRAGVVALEAMRSLHDPAFQALRGAIAGLGAIRRATLRFGKYSSRYDEILAGRGTNIFDCRMASGSLMDIGVYTVEPLIELFGEPVSIGAAASLLDAGTRGLTHGAIDGAGVIMTRYPTMVATLHHSKITNDASESEIEGELGTLVIDAISSPAQARLEMRKTGSRADSVGYSSAQTSRRIIELPHVSNTMVHELADFAEAVRGAMEGIPLSAVAAGPFGTLGHFQQVTLSSLALMDEARRQMGVRFPSDDGAGDGGAVDDGAAV